MIVPKKYAQANEFQFGRTVTDARDRGKCMIILTYVYKKTNTRAFLPLSKECLQ